MISGAILRMDIPVTPFEHGLMFVLTGLTNFACFPLLFLSYRRATVFHWYVGFFTFFSSFMYHSQEALGLEEVYLTVSQWHRLDNIGSILAWIMIMVNFMDNLDRDATGAYVSPVVAKLDYHLLYGGLILTLVMQTKHPWDLENTLVPIIVASVVAGVKVFFIRRPRIDLQYVKLGTPFFVAALYCFAKGLNEHEDYLRIHHGLWHLFGSIGIFYLWQSVDKMRHDPCVAIAKFEEVERFGLLTCLSHMLGLSRLRVDTKVKSQV